MSDSAIHASTATQIKKVLVTGSAGFIGHAMAKRLLSAGMQVVGIDDLNAYYDVRLKHARLSQLQASASYLHYTVDIADRARTEQVFAEHTFDAIVHLGAQAGVRYSSENPHVYAQSNMVGFLHILEGARAQSVKHLIFASTSSVYGANPDLPFAETQVSEHPLSFYAATKKANEAMAHAYAHLYQIPVTGLRFFTVYGPWGRPDMALFKFAKAIINDQPIDLYSHGHHKRSFTYIDDVIEGCMRLLMRPALINNHRPAGSAVAPYQVFNIGSSASVPLLHYVELLEKHLAKTAKKRFLPAQAGDMADTEASGDALNAAIDYAPKIDVDTGIAHFVAWCKAHPEFFN
jgi:UDP-glucuronate 4-epimerase